MASIQLTEMLCAPSKGPETSQKLFLLVNFMKYFLSVDTDASQTYKVLVHTAQRPSERFNQDKNTFIISHNIQPEKDEMHGLSWG